MLDLAVIILVLYLFQVIHEYNRAQLIDDIFALYGSVYMNRHVVYYYVT